MIFETDIEKDVKKVGDIQNNNVSIDTSNIDFIVTILSTNLYSKPIESFIRETVSNAWDSHKEAGIEDPVILEIMEDSEGVTFCKIQDFGVGLSPERFQKVYRNIGSSTKRSDNEQIGGFGIGRFSALAYTDVVHITSNYDGFQYIYMMYKDGNSISIDLLDTKATDQRNGLEVKVEIANGDYHRFCEAIKTQLVYFENLYIIDSSDIGGLSLENQIQYAYNNFKIKKYTNFWVNNLDYSSTISLVLGKVRYPLRIGSLDKMYSSKVSDYPISLIFEIGELDVTPNREEILYSSKNKALIEARLDLAVAEIDVLIEAEKTKDCSTISEYLNEINNTQWLSLLSPDNGTNNRNVSIKLSNSKRKLTLNGEYFEPKNFKGIHDLIFNTNAIEVNYKLRGNQIQYNQSKISLHSVKNNFDLMYLSDGTPLKNITKRYIRDVLADSTSFLKANKSTYSYIKFYMRYVKDSIDSSKRYGWNRDYKNFDLKAFKVIAESFMKNISKIPKFNDSTVPLKWIADTKAADKLKRGQSKKAGIDWSQNVNLFTLRHMDSGYGVTVDSASTPLKDIHKKFKSLTIYAEKDNPKIRTLFKYLKNGKIKPNMVELAPTKVKLLKGINNFIHINDFMNANNKLIRNIATVEYLKREIPYLGVLNTISNLESVSERLSLAVKTLSDFSKVYSSGRDGGRRDEADLIKEIFEMCEEKDHFNEEIRGIFEANKEELKNAAILVTFSESNYAGRKIPNERVNLVVDYVLVRKLIRPSVKAVLKLKKETIFNLKIEEDESN